ncbi:glycosyltransferase family 4 protein [Acinetobacter terrestris]|uniref:Glycosyltransferase family 4 protein n=1 Tax=Acinetobacter terrestris TaxID=2529843 RepID=A0AAW6UX34_9GAMM|nr:glycosyltransferase family 4 protein [Acinetobacter terrestris]MDK1684853.1 glycosyltransferase family 4 protein [Acinetobacter terrestris]
MKWHLTQIGSREKYLYPRMIYRKGLLGTFNTDIWFKNVNSLNLPGKFSRIKSRYHYELKEVQVNSRNLYSICRMLKPYKGNRFDQWCAQGRIFGNWAANNIIKNGIDNNDTVFGYTGASLEIAETAKSVGARMVLGQFDPAFYWYKIQNLECEKWYGKVLNSYIPTDEYKERLLKEWNHSDLIIVNSEHCKDALIPYGVNREKIKILPLPVSIDRDTNISEKFLANEKIKVIFVGNISFGKGFAYFAEAKKILNNDKRLSFYAIGDLHISQEIIEKNKWDLNYTGRLNREELKKMYLDSHILVFPTLSEGFGQVQLEAMAYGLPVIATEKCGRIVENKRNGIIVKDSNAREIAEAILEIAEDRVKYSCMSYCALQTIMKYEFLEIEKKFWEIIK